MANRRENNGNSGRPKWLQNHCSHEIKTLALWKKSYDQPRQHIKKQRHHFADKGLYIVKAMVFPLVMNDVRVDLEEAWIPKNWCFWIAVLEKTLESPLDYKEIQPVHPKGDQSWVFIGRSDVEAETLILWPPDVKSWLIGKDPNAGKEWRQEEKGTTEDEMFGWHHWLSGQKFELTLGNSEGHGSLAGCSPWGHKESDMTELLNNECKAETYSGAYTILYVKFHTKWILSLRLQ